MEINNAKTSVRRKVIAALLNEAAITDVSLIKQIDEFSEILLKIKELEAELEKLGKQKKALQQTLYPIIKALTTVEDKAVQTETYVLKIRSDVTTRETIPYKEMFFEALKKFNEETRNTLIDMAKKQASISVIQASFTAIKKENIQEAISLKNIISKLSSIIKSLFFGAKTIEKNIDTLLSTVKQINP